MERRGPGYNIPIWIRLTWVDFTPDDDQLSYNDFEGHGREHGSAVRWTRNRPQIPDRWIYHLFMAGRSNVEIGRLLRMDKDWVAERLNKLEEAHWITREMRVRRNSLSAHRRRKHPVTPIKKPKYPRLYRMIGEMIRKGRTIREIRAELGGSMGTVTRYAAIWRERIREEELHYLQAGRS